MLLVGIMDRTYEEAVPRVRCRAGTLKNRISWAHAHLVKRLRMDEERRYLLFRDQRGVAAVEFAIMAPVLIAIFMAIVEIGCILYTLMTAEIATADVSRQLSANYIQSSQVQQIISKRMPPWAQAHTTAIASASGSPVVWTITTTVPMASATPTNFFASIYGIKSIYVKSIMQQEPTS